MPRSKYEGLNASDRARARMRYMGMTPNGHPLWTKKEDQYVRELYPDYTALKNQLRRRSRRSISWRAGVLGVSRKHSAWTGAEVARLRRLWRDATREELSAEFPRHPWGSIAVKGQSFGVRRRPWAPKRSTGFRLLDEIRRRAADQRRSLTELDRVCACPGYFENSGYRAKMPRRNVLLRAIEELGGHVEIVWR